MRREEGESETEPAAGQGRRWTIVLLLLLLSAGLVLFVVFQLRLGAAPSPRPVHVADVESERLLGMGSVVGFAAPHATHAWLGIPYAKPPVGPLRWRAPEAPEAWGDTLDALAPGSPCVQLGSRLGGVRSEEEDGFAGDEDCLYLNVWAPRQTEEEAFTEPQRPVMVWIHGGGNTVGTGGAGLYDGARLAGSQGVVVVTLNYRLGALGWFSHPALRRAARDEIEASGNFGTLDQIAALEWVRDQIEAFGGDPGNVTVFGESAGGRNIFALMLAERARGLFHRAVIQSGATDAYSRAAAENAAADLNPGHRNSSREAIVELLEQSGVVPDREAARDYAEVFPDDELLAFLRGLSAREIIGAYREMQPSGEAGLEVPTLIRDGALLPAEEWTEAFRGGRFAKVPVLLGTNRDEQKLFLSQDLSFVRRRFGLLYTIQNPEAYASRAREMSEAWAIRGVIAPAAAMAKSGHDAIYAYRFDWDDLPTRMGVDFAELLGAAHGFEMPFIFGNYDLGDPLLNRALFPEETLAARERLFRQMSGYWGAFAKSGRPGRGGPRDGSVSKQAEWLPWQSGRPGEPARRLIMDDEAEGGIRMAPVDRAGLSR
ncbi:MAG: carboxylesterase/lipase family protein [Myxococcota bacterium]